MKIRIATFGLLLSLAASMSAHAQEEQGGEKSGEKFSAHKTEMVARLNKEKAMIETTISCVNSAAKKEDLQKCHEQKKASMDAFRQEGEALQKKRMAERKEKLQKELNEIDAKSAQVGTKNTSDKQ